MKTIGIEFDACGEATMILDGQRIALAACNVSITREPERDRKAERESGDGFIRYKPGKEIKIEIIGITAP